MNRIASLFPSMPSDSIAGFVPPPSVIELSEHERVVTYWARYGTKVGLLIGGLVGLFWGVVLGFAMAKGIG